MCGIAGAFSRCDGPLGKQAQWMADAMGHRGPDAQGTATFEAGCWHGAFGHRRLAVIDPDPEGTQPFRVPDLPLILVYNGELYNYRTLRADLAAMGDRFVTRTDTEVLLRAFARWDLGCLDRCEGMFAFAVWDERRRRLVMARDRFGIKPIYYSHTPDRLVFASEVRAILASSLVPPALEPMVLAGYLETGSVVSPLTTVRGVVSLAPGHAAEWSDGALRLSCYWDLGKHVPPAGGPYHRCEELARLLPVAVESEMVSDVPIGVFLSGGIDSSAIVACLASAGTRDLHTVSLVFEEAEFDERKHSEAVARLFGTDHHAMNISARGVAELLPRTGELQDQPSVDGLNTHIVSRAAREAGLTVALSGLGGDELFAGYPSFRLARLWGRYGSLLRATPGSIRRGVAAVVGGVARGRYGKPARLVAEAVNVEDIYAVTRQLFTPETTEALLPPAQRVASPGGAKVRAALGRMDPLNAVTLMEASRYMLDTILRQADIMSMAASLEMRVPLLNHRLAEWVVGTDPALRVSQRDPKPLLLGALPVPLPRSVTHRRKGTFTLPFAIWLRGEYRGLVEELLLSRRTRERGLFAPAVCVDLWQGFLSGRPGVTWSRIWALCAFEAWCRHHLDRPPAT
jgi:asparagine synthase (glutamine-hydrolysing)